MNKVYDCFTFFNEIELLEIRLNELNDVVDYFVIVEATRTFQKKRKPLYLNLDDPRIIGFKQKIIHIVVDDFPNFFTHFRIPKVWDYEKHQRNAIARGLLNAKEDDIILISDVDEIPSSEQVKQNLDLNEPVVFQQRLFYYFLNYAMSDTVEDSVILKNAQGEVYWRGTVMLRYNDFTSNAHTLRELRNNVNTTQVEEAGWHFSYIGGVEAVISKLKSFSHKKEAVAALDDLDDKQKILDIITSGGDLFNRGMSFKAIAIENVLPKYVTNNKDKFESLLCKI